MTNNAKKGKLSLFTKFGYGIGTAADVIPYGLFFTYFIFYLTDVAGLPAGQAGTIMFLATVWQAVTGPLFGYISDNSKNPKGRRRPILIKVIFPYTAILVLLFAPVDLTGAVQFAYYLIAAMILQTCYSAFKGPWDALGAELTQDYKERNDLRFSVALCSYPTQLVASSGTIAIVGMVASAKKGWFLGAVVCAAVMLVCGFISVISTKGKEPVHVHDGEKFEFSFVGLFKDYASLLKIKAYRILITFMFIFIVGYTILCNCTVYSLTYNAQLTEAQQSIFWMANTIICICLLPVVTMVANKIDKKVCVILFCALYSIADVIFYFTGINGFASALIFSFCVGMATSSFYGIFYSLIYDCCELYELTTGERTEGGIMALAQLSQTLAAAVAGLVFGWLLSGVGYTGTGVESASTINGMLAIVTLVPAAFGIVGILILFMYRINNERFSKVLEAVEAKKAGKDVDLADFKDLI